MPFAVKASPRIGDGQGAGFRREKAQETGRVTVAGVHQVGLYEHHLLPILMSITIGYVPDKKILGLSKHGLAEYFFARLCRLPTDAGI